MGRCWLLSLVVFLGLEKFDIGLQFFGVSYVGCMALVILGLKTIPSSPRSGPKLGAGSFIREALRSGGSRTLVPILSYGPPELPFVIILLVATHSLIGSPGLP